MAAKHTSTKAHYASAGSGLAAAVMWYMTRFVPWWGEMPMDVQAAHVAAVLFGIPWLVTHFSPGNRALVPTDATKRHWSPPDNAA